MGYIRQFINWHRLRRPGTRIVTLPHSHVVQIGDPVLRRPAREVPNSSFKSKELKGLILRLTDVMRNYQCIGLSAPQIGIDLRVFVMEFTEKQFQGIDKETILNREISVVPLTVFVNPTLKIIDYTNIVYDEGCESVRGYEAEVPRYREVLVNGFNGDGEAFSKQFSGWPARMAQHEFDHINGKLYTDIMDRSTFTNIIWSDNNICKGKLDIKLRP